jgi:hypothetical protein
MISGPFFRLRSPRDAGFRPAALRVQARQDARIGHFLGKRRPVSLLGLRVCAAHGLAKTTTYVRRFTPVFLVDFEGGDDVL